MVKMILCTDSKHGIGKDGSIPWHSKADFEHFKAETDGKKIIMGYKTWLSLPKKPLSNRLNVVVVSREVPEEELVVHKDVIYIQEAQIKSFIRANTDIVIIGGAKLYKKLIHVVDEVILSQINGDFECDAFFDINDHGIPFIAENMKILSDGIIVTYLKKDKEYKNENIFEFGN